MNPVGGCGHTNLEHARRFVRRGRARFLPDGRLEFISARHQAAAAEAHRRVLSNGSGRATLKAVKGLPTAGDVVKVFMGKRDFVPVGEDMAIPEGHPSIVPLSVTHGMLSIPITEFKWPLPLQRAQ